MCGLAGFMSQSSRNADEMANIATAMTSNIISHRRCASGAWTERASGIAIGFHPLASAPIRQMRGEHLRGERDWHDQLWAILMFHAWLERAHNERAGGLAPAIVRTVAAEFAVAR